MGDNINYCIKKTNILLVEVKVFKEFLGYGLAEEDLSRKERYRKVLFYDHMFIDLETGDELAELWDKDGDVKRPIYANTRYISTTYLNPDTTDEDLMQAANVYELAVLRKRLIQEKKLIMFPKKRLY